MTPIAVAQIAGGLAIVITIVVLVVTRVVDFRPPPTLTANNYLSAISRGDAATANAMFDPQTIEQARLATLTDQTGLMSDLALGEAVERISDVHIDRVTRSRATSGAVVYFSYTLAGERFTEETINFRWRAGAWVLVTGVWQILQVQARYAGDGIDKHITFRLGVAQPDFPLAESFLAYPAVYPFAVISDQWIPDPATPTTITLGASTQSMLLTIDLHAA